MIKQVPRLVLKDYPQLQMIAWSRDPESTIGEDDALALYERNWGYVDTRALTDRERALIDRLVKEYGNGVLHV